MTKNIYTLTHIYTDSVKMTHSEKQEKGGKIMVHVFLCFKFSVAFLLNGVPMLST